MKTYLKNSKYSENDVILFDSDKLCRISIFRKETCNIDQYDDLEDLNFALERDLKDGHRITTKEIFDAEHKGFAMRLNNLTKI